MEWRGLYIELYCHTEDEKTECARQTGLLLTRLVASISRDYLIKGPTCYSFANPTA